MNIFRFISILDDLDTGEVDRRIIQRGKDYVDTRVFRAEVVQTLPQNADAGHLFATPSDPTGLYMGRGPTQTLLKFTGTPLP